MYLGLFEHKFNIYVDKTNPLGVRYKKLHTYQCERCGYVSRVLLKAEEPFYCECQRLIGIEPKQQPQEATS